MRSGCRPQKDGARFGAALDFVGEQDDFNFGVFPQERVTLDSYVLLSATAEWPLTERISLTLRGENLLDEEATDVFGYANPGAAGFIGLKLR
jgi:vitamin B12 transporter